jgi:arylsulfatase
VHEGGISTPLIAHWPEVIRRKGELTDEPGHVVDLMATCCDVAGAGYPETYKGKSIAPLDGRSLVSVFRTGKREGHEAIYWEHEGNRAVRKGDWKLVSRFPGKWELYNLKDDRTELKDMSSEHPELVEELSRMYRSWAARSNVEPWGQLRKKPAANNAKKTGNTTTSGKKK